MPLERQIRFWNSYIYFYFCTSCIMKNNNSRARTVSLIAVHNDPVSSRDQIRLACILIGSIVPQCCESGRVTQAELGRKARLWRRDVACRQARLRNM